MSAVLSEMERTIVRLRFERIRLALDGFVMAHLILQNVAEQLDMIVLFVVVE